MAGFGFLYEEKGLNIIQIAGNWDRVYYVTSYMALNLFAHCMIFFRIFSYKKLKNLIVV